MGSPARPVAASENFQNLRHSMIGMSRSITAARHRAEDELRRAKSDAEADSKAKSGFLANLCHELNTPLNAMLGFTDLIRMETFGALGNPRYVEYIDDIHQSGVHLRSLLSSVLTAMRIDSGVIESQIEPFELDTLIGGAAKMISVAAERKNLKLVLHYHLDRHGIYRGDRTKICQILLILLGNAVKFTDTGEICLEVRSGTPREGLPCLRYAVRDQGIGISREAQGRLFQMFCQADDSIGRRYGGSGLGLAIGRRLVESMGGEIGVISEPGQGAEFWFEVPVGTADDVVILPDGRS